MKLAITAAFVAVSQCSPVAAQERECFDAATSLEGLVRSGFTIRFGDTSGEFPIFMVQNQTGAWGMFSIEGQLLCPIAGGDFGVYTPQDQPT